MKARFTAGAAILVLTLGACAPTGPVEQQKTPRDLWIEAHPTHIDDRGLCREFDNELCDEDPYDLDDLFEPGEVKSPKVVKPSSKPKVSPKPRSTRR